MKILHYTGMYSTKYGGIEKFNVELLRRGVELGLVYNAMPCSLRYVDDLNNKNAKIFISSGSRFKRVFSFLCIVKREKPEIIHYHFGGLLYILVPLISLFFPKISQVYTLHCEMSNIEGIQKKLFKFICKYLDLVISVSEGVRNGLISKVGYNKKFVVSYLGVEKGNIVNKNLRTSLNLSLKDKIITSIGWDIDIKGFDVLVKAISSLKAKCIVPSFKVIVIGLSTEEDSKFQTIIRQHGVEELFLSVGIRDDIDDFLAISDIYVQPSRTEAISLSIMEALNHGLPIIGTHVGGIPEVCIDGENGFLVEKCDYLKLADCIKMLLSDINLCKSMGDRSLKLSKKFDLKIQVGKLIHIYENVLKH